MTEVQEYLSRMKKIQEAILTYIEDDDSSQKNYMELIKLFINFKVQINKHDLKTILRIISNIADYHYRGPNFFDKIRKIFQYLKVFIKNNFSNYSIFNVFRYNKKILLMLIQEQIIIVDKAVASVLLRKENKKVQYFSKYIKPFSNEDIEPKNVENFDEKQEIGENYSPQF